MSVDLWAAWAFMMFFFYKFLHKRVLLFAHKSQPVKSISKNHFALAARINVALVRTHAYTDTHRRASGWAGGCANMLTRMHSHWTMHGAVCLDKSKWCGVAWSGIIVPFICKKLLQTCYIYYAMKWDTRFFIQFYSFSLVLTVVDRSDGLRILSEWERLLTHSAIYQFLTTKTSAKLLDL